VPERKPIIAVGYKLFMYTSSCFVNHISESAHFLYGLRVFMTFWVQRLITTHHIACTLVYCTVLTSWRKTQIFRIWKRVFSGQEVSYYY